MFNSNPLGPHNFNEGMIDRLLGKAYLTIKEVHDNLPDIVKAIAVSEDSKELTASIDKLSEVLKGFNASAGMFLGHDLGTVGEPVDSNTFVGENYLSEFTKSAEQVKIVGDNIDVVNRLVVHINELKAIAEALTSLLTVNDNLPEIIKTNEQLTDIKVVASNISDVRSVKECLSEIITLAESINYFPEIIHSADDIAKVAKYISSLVICAGNIATYVEANERLKTAQEVIANDNLATVANNVKAVKSVAAKMADIETLNQLDPRITTLETTTADHETRITANKKVIDNHELRLNNIETTTDLGQVTLRITAIEAKNKEQDTSLEANATAIAKEVSDREQAITTEAKAREDADNALGVRIDNADAKNTEQDTKLGTIDTHLETIDTHLGTIDDKNTAQDTALDTAKSELNTSISALLQKVQVNKADIDELKKQASSGLELLTVLIMPLGVDETENQFRYLNGQVIMQDQFADFTSKLKARMALFPSLFTTEENWQAEKTNSKLGQCGKFVVDNDAGTIRLPCVVNINGLTDLTKCGVVKLESLPNITGDVSIGYGLANDVANNVRGAFTKGTIACNALQGAVENGSVRVAFDASYSAPTYQNNAHVQQEAIQYPYVIVVGVKAKEATKPINDYQINNVYSFGMSQYYKGTMNNNSWLRSNNQWNSGTVYVDFYAWLTEHLNANDAGFKLSTATDITDYDYVINTTDQTFRLPLLNGKETSVGSNYQSVTVKASGSTYTAPANGWFVAYNANRQGGVCRLINTTKHISSLSAPVSGFSDGMTFVPVATGDVVELAYTGVFGLASGYFYFIPAQGDGNLYYYIGDTLQNASLINVARIEEKLVDKVDKDFEIEFNTGWFVPAASSTVAFDLTGTGFDLLTAEQKEKIKVHSLVKVIAAENGFQVGDLIELSADDHAGATGNSSLGFISIIRGNSLIVTIGNLSIITAVFSTNYTLLSKTNSQLKVTLTYKKD